MIYPWLPVSSLRLAQRKHERREMDYLMERFNKKIVMAPDALETPELLSGTKLSPGFRLSSHIRVLK